MERNDPRDKVNLFHISREGLLRNGSISPTSLNEIMSVIAPMVGARRAASQARSQAKMARVIQATAEIIDDLGPEAVNTSAVAARAGVSVGWLYNFFDDREALLEEILVAGLRNLDERLEAVGFTFAGSDWRPAVEAGVDATIEFFTDSPGFRLLWNSTEFSGRMIQANRMHDELLASYLAASATRVRSDAPDVPLETVAKIFVGMLDKGVDLYYRDDPKNGDPELWAEVKRAGVAYLEMFLA